MREIQRAVTIPRKYTYFKSIIFLIAGIFGGILLSRIILSVSGSNENCKYLPVWGEIFPHNLGEEALHSKLIYVGIMTTRKFLNSRVAACFNTWVQTIPGTVHFYCSEATEEDRRRNPNLKIISIPNTDDGYPPKSKAFRLLKYMWDNFGGEYEWFMRADDDAYIKGDKLGEYLRRINSSAKHYVGQMGLGLPEDRLSMGWDENFCLGGPGIILSKALMETIAPFIEYCLKQVPTIWDDVGIGRCTKVVAGTSCTWNFEHADLFMQNYGDPDYKTFNHSLKMPEIHNAITMHSLKTPSYQYRMHLYLNNRKIADMKQKILKLRREVQMFDKYLNRGKTTKKCEECLFPSINKTQPKRRGEVLTWDFFTKDRIHSPKSEDPQLAMDISLKSALKDVRINLDEITNEKARVKGRMINVKKINFGYRRVNPFYGADYVLDMKAKFKKLKGERYEMEVRKYAYIHRTFTDIEFMEIEHDIPADPKANAATVSPSLLEVERILPLYAGQDHIPPHKERVVNFILPFTGKYITFINFLTTFEETCLKGEKKLKLVVIMGNNAEADITRYVKDYIKNLRGKYPQHTLRLGQLGVKFNRALAIQKGVDYFNFKDLVYFADAEFSISRELLTRIKLNTIKGEQVYYPIPFKRHSPKPFCENDLSDDCLVAKDPRNFSDIAGHWDSDSYRTFSAYKRDFLATGGFSVTAGDWDQQDEDLYQKFMAQKTIQIFRAPDHGLIQKYDPIECNPDDSRPVFNSCYKSKMSSVGSLSSMAEYIYTHNLPG